MQCNDSKKPSRLMTWLILLGLLVLVSAMVSYFFLDARIAFWVRNDFSRDLRNWADWYTHFGDAGFWLKWFGIIGIVAVVLLILPSLAKRYAMHRTQAALNKINKLAWDKLLGWITLGFATIAASGLFVNLLKITLGRKRPHLLFEEDAFGFAWFNVSYLYNSFPSGHAATAGSLMVVAMLAWPRLNLIWLVLGITLMFSRVFVTAHYLSDILVGGYIGVVFAILMGMFWQDRKWINAGFKSA